MPANARRQMGLGALAQRASATPRKPLAMEGSVDKMPSGSQLPRNINPGRSCRSSHPLMPAPGARLATVFSAPMRSEEHTSELQSLMRISYAVFCLKKKNETSTPILRSPSPLQLVIHILRNQPTTTIANTHDTT